MSIRPHSAQLRPISPSVQRGPLTATTSTSSTGVESPTFEEWEEVDERVQEEEKLKLAKEEELQRLSRECRVSTRTRDGVVNYRHSLALCQKNLTVQAIASTLAGGNPGANLRSISHRCHPILVAFVWELTK